LAGQSGGANQQNDQSHFVMKELQKPLEVGLLNKNHDKSDWGVSPLLSVFIQILINGFNL